MSKKYRAVNGFIFAGSFSIGVMNAGFELEKVLEIDGAFRNEMIIKYREIIEKTGE